MKRLISRIGTAAITFCIGVTAASMLVKLSMESTKSSSADGNARHLASHVDEIVQTTTTHRRLEGLSPYQISVYINGNPWADASEVWQRLGIGPHDFRGDKGFVGYCNGCEAETYNYELDEEPGKEVLLRISAGFQGACRYLIFKRVEPYLNDEWKLLGHIDDGFGKHRMPQHYCYLSGGKSWLVIQTEDGSGSGMSLYVDRVFTTNKRGVKEVLTYPSEGHQEGIGCEPNREFSARLSGFQLRKNNPSLTVEFAVGYSDDQVIFNKTQRAVYVRRPGSGKYHLDKKSSELTQKEIRCVYDINSLSREDFLKYNYEDLIKIAHGKDRQAKDWLRLYLAECTNFSEQCID